MPYKYDYYDYYYLAYGTYNIQKATLKLLILYFMCNKNIHIIY